MSARAEAKAQLSLRFEPADVPEEFDTRPNLRVVRHRDRRSSIFTKFGVLLLLALFVAVLGIVVFQTMRAQNQARLDDLDRQIAVQEDRSKGLRLQLADAEAPDRIATAARTRLGMIPPNDVAWLKPKVDDDAKAAWDPAKEPLPAPPTTAAPPPSIPPSTLPTTVPLSLIHI